jgi:FKBP-type peptidyl-prolyl cis-trans isomerase
MSVEKNFTENDVVEVKATNKQNIIYTIEEDTLTVTRADTIQSLEAAEEEEEEEEVVEEAAEEEEVVEEAAEEEEEEVEEEAAEEEEEEEEEEVEEEAAEEEEEEEEAAEEEEGEEVYEVTIKGKKYYTTNESNGTIYSIDVNGELDSEVGKFVNGAPVFNK